MRELIKEQNIHGNRKYKDTLFRMVFSEKKDLLELYNAINGTSYNDVNDLSVNTLEHALFMGVKNDISFLIGCTMNLYEHQSSKNENMPIRGLIYLTKLLEDYIAENKLNLFTSKLQKLPTPQYIVFYNGTDREPDERILKLSDAFVKDGGCLECEVRLLNINYGHNRALMEKCRRLKDYAIFIATVRMYLQSKSKSLEEAILNAIDECIDNGVLADILRKQRSEVLSMVLSTFNKEWYERDLKEVAYEEGYNARLYSQIRKKLEKGKSVEIIAEELEEDMDVIKKLVAEMEL